MNPSYFLKRDTAETGPYSLDQLRHMERSGELRVDDLLRTDGSIDWKPAYYVAGLFGRAMPMSKNTKVLVGVGAGCGLLAIGVVGLLFLVAIFSSDSGSTQRGSSEWQPRIEEQLRQHLTHSIEGSKQQIFSAIHPLGTAKISKVHEVTIDAWRGGRDTQQWADVKQFTVTYTIYWEGPITKDGYTKISQTYDAESQRYVSGRVLHTNGTTNSDVTGALAETAGFLGGVLLYDSLHRSE